MPTYEYDCAACGPFSTLRPMAEYALPAPCPACGAAAPRALSSAQALQVQASAPRQGPSRFSATSGHGSGCRCCTGSVRIPRETWMKKLT